MENPAINSHAPGNRDNWTRIETHGFRGHEVGMGNGIPLGEIRGVELICEQQFGCLKRRKHFNIVLDRASAILLRDAITNSLGL